MDRIAILGAGGMGTALAILLARRGKTVTLWARNPSVAESLSRTRENVGHLPGARIPDEARITSSASAAVEDAELLIAAVPSQYLRAALDSIASDIPSGVPVLSVVKGIEFRTSASPSRIILETTGPRPTAVLSGPGHAEELARGLPASLVTASSDETLALRIRDALNGAGLRIYSHDDVTGVELAGALKNVLGIAAGICDGLGFGDNAKAALLTRGLVEMARFACAFGGSRHTFQGLAGVGDVIATCFSKHGRNRGVGERIGRGESLESILASMSDVAEGVPTCRSVREMAQRVGIEMPICGEVHRILFEGKPPRDAVVDLMLRDPKGEWRP